MTTTFLAKDRDGLWKLIRSLKRFTLSDLHQKSTMDRSSIKTYLTILAKGGFLVEKKAHKGQPAIFSLVKDNGVLRPELTPDGKVKGPNGRQRMWSAMKVLKQFTFRDLSLAAAVGDLDARGYCHQLRNAKYLVVLQASRPMVNSELYSFDTRRDTGPLAPQIKRDGSIYDRNLARTVWPESEAA